MIEELAKQAKDELSEALDTQPQAFVEERIRGSIAKLDEIRRIAADMAVDDRFVAAEAAVLQERPLDPYEADERAFS